MKLAGYSKQNLITSYPIINGRRLIPTKDAIRKLRSRQYKAYMLLKSINIYS